MKNLRWYDEDKEKKIAFLAEHFLSFISFTIKSYWKQAHTTLIQQKAISLIANSVKITWYKSR